MKIKKQVILGGVGIAIASYIILRQSKVNFIKKTFGDSCFDKKFGYGGSRGGWMANYFSKELIKDSEFWNHKLGGFVLKTEPYEGESAKYHLFPIERFIFGYAKKLKQNVQGDPRGKDNFEYLGMPAMAVDFDYEEAKKGECY
jgi:hypothetical protein